VFAILGLLLTPGRLGEWLGPSIGLAVVLLFLARPLAVLVVTAAERLTGGERVVLAWAGLRGAGPIVFATFPVLASVEHADRVYSVVFYVVLLSTLVQGTTFTALARAMGLTTSPPVLPRTSPPSPLVVAPWSPADGDPADPPDIFGVAVGERVIARRDRPGALFALADGRLAVTGPVIAAGPGDELARYARRRLQTAADHAEGEWWSAVAAALAPARRTRRPGSARSGQRPPPPP
jgi:hypothetical protein